jgi:L-lysine 6-oxidase
LIVDPGPRTISGRNSAAVEFDADSVPASYPHAHFPNDTPKYGTPVKNLGTLKTDAQGRLIVLGGYGDAGGDEPLESYGGANTWHDDTADGPVYCTVTYTSNKEQKMMAWVIIGSPDFAPEIVNISTLSDTFFDVGVRSFNLVPLMFSKGKYNPKYVANFQRDIRPIIDRISNYQWVANVQSMSGFFSSHFDYTDNGSDSAAKRQTYYDYFRGQDNKLKPAGGPQEVLFSTANGGQLPMMPLNSGSNSVSNVTIEKFLALDATQMFLLGQWAAGKFDNLPDKRHPVNALDQGSVGNCIGLPMCPGIEVTWSLQDPTIYASAYQIAHQTSNPNGYDATGLTPSRNECDPGLLVPGCQPGDLTKRMACPWQADFFQCTIQYINFSDSEVNKATKTTNSVEATTESWEGDDGRSLGKTGSVEVSHKVDKTEPLTPTYYGYWWPPQSPWDVLTGEITQTGQADSDLPAGQQVNYQRGINSFTQMVEHWSALAFIRNNNAANSGFPYFTETERNNELFEYKEVGMAQLTGNSGDDGVSVPIFFIDADTKTLGQKGDKGKLMAAFFETRAFKPIAVAAKGLGLPRSGTRLRR